MIYEDDRSVDEIVDEFFADEDEGVREEKTAAAGDGQKAPRLYLNRCKDCRTTFESPYVGGKYCPACKRRRISEGQKARQARERQKRAAASAGPSRLPPTGAAARPDENSTNLYPSDELQAKWEALKEAEDTSSAPPEPEPPEREPESHPREAREVLMDLYGTVRNLARAAGLDPSRTIEALWEVDSIFGNVGRA